MSTLTQSPAWQNLGAHAATFTSADLPSVPQQFFIDFEGLRVDLGRHWLMAETLPLLIKLAEQQQVPQWRDKMFAGEKINHTEDRAVLHTALRDMSHPEVTEMKQKLYRFADKIRAEKKIKSVVNIGIGGSDLGPRLVTESLRAFHDTDMDFHFVSNVDASDLMEVLRQCDPKTTLFIVASKTFTTQETLANAETAKKWLMSALGEAAVKDHFVALSTALDKVATFGIASENIFGFWDWVGGRYSVWSAIGLPVMLAVGPKIFEEFLRGAHEMDTHFRQAPLAENIPVLLGCLAVWYRNFFHLPCVAVLPYDQHLANLPRYLQQLDMESLGKRVDRDGNVVDYDTGAILFGEAGTNGQHAFYQLLHQGTTIVPAEFILTHTPHYKTGDHHKLLMSNAIAQPDALWMGRGHDDAYREFPGCRPSTLVHLPILDARYMGMLLAMYEHKVFVQSVLWNINAFDQFGVQLGKEMANALLR